MSTEGASIFQVTVKNYLGQVAQCDWQALTTPLAISLKNGSLSIPFFNRRYFISADKITDRNENQPSHSVCVLLCRYILQGHTVGHRSFQGQLVTYKDFRNAAPFAGGFANMVHKPIASRFSGRLRALRRACQQLGARPYECPTNCELSVMLPALPRVPIYLVFSDADEEFPSNCTVLFQRDADQFLDMECLAIIGDQLATRLFDHDR